MNRKKRCLPLFIITSICLFSFTGCSKKENGPVIPSTTIPVLTTAEITGISFTTAISGGEVTSDGGLPVSSRGVCWSESAMPEITDPHSVNGSGTGLFVSQLTGLKPNTLLFIRAYATNTKGIAYGSIRSFKTLKVTVDSVTDLDGNIYHVAPVGTQFWLRENLRVTRFRNGDAIPNVTVESTWKNLTTGAYCTFDNQPSNGAVYGNLYNWHALNDNRGLCPTGWHAPSDAEWAAMSTFLGGDTVAGGLLKSTGTIEGSTGLWYAPNTGATNSSGFTGLPGGSRINYGTFYSLGNLALFWSSSDTALVNAWTYILDANNGELKRNFNFKTNGFSVRCCKD